MAGFTASSSSPFPFDFAVARYKVTTGLEERLYVQHDAIHNVTSIADPFGEVKERYVYDPQGNYTVLQANWTIYALGTHSNWYRTFQGKEYDGVTDSFDFNNRRLKPIGRFMQVDPIPHSDSRNPYQAMMGNPLSYTDALGLRSEANGGPERTKGGYEPPEIAEWRNAEIEKRSRQRVAQNYAYLISIGYQNRVNSPGYGACLAQGVANTFNGGVNALISIWNLVMIVGGEPLAVMEKTRFAKDMFVDQTDAEFDTNIAIGEFGASLAGPTLVTKAVNGVAKVAGLVSKGKNVAQAESVATAAAEASGGEIAICKNVCFLAGTPILLGDRQDFANIEDIYVGQRVATDGGAANSADGKAQASDPNATEVDPATWRLVDLTIFALTDDGRIDIMDVQELMPVVWLEQQHASAGGWIPVPLDLGDINEVGQGALVDSIQPCPKIEDGLGRVVISTITHLNDYGFHLTLTDSAGKQETLGITGFHKLYSEDRGWMSAADLYIGEHIRGDYGELMVTNLVRDPGVHRVYNMTVEEDHDYFSGSLMALSHNSKECFGSYTNTHQSGTKYVGKGSPQRMQQSANEKAIANDDVVVHQDWTPAASAEDAFVQEALRLRAAGGPGGNTYNLINSPGETILEMLGL